MVKKHSVVSASRLAYRAQTGGASGALAGAWSINIQNQSRGHYAMNVALPQSLHVPAILMIVAARRLGTLPRDIGMKFAKQV